MKKIKGLLFFIVMFFLIGCQNDKVYVSFITNTDTTLDKVLYDENFTLPQLATIEGKEFAGWYLDKEFKHEYKGEQIDESTNLYAKWNDLYYYVTFRDKNGKLIYTTHVKHGQEAIAPSNDLISIPGWTFLGWDKDITNITSDITVQGNYSEDFYEVTFDTGEAEPLESINNLRYGDVIKLNTTITNGNYYFAGWMLDGEFISSTYEVTRDVTLIAKWADMNTTYDITIDTNGGNNLASMTFFEFATVTLPTPKREGFTFSHWEINETKVENSFIYVYDEAITAKAIWSRDLIAMINSSQTTTTTVYNSGDRRVETEQTDTPVNYLYTSDSIMIPTQYVSLNNEEFRGLEINIDDFNEAVTVEEFQTKIADILTVAKEYKLNTIIFKVRANNQANYHSLITNVNSSLTNLGNWNFLTYFIEQCHTQNIDFIASLDMCLIDSTTSYDSLEEVTELYANVNNPAKNSQNILLASDRYPYLNPAKKEVQDYLIAIISELVNNYDIDAIQINDNFYGQSSSGKRLLDELDQADFEAYVATNANLNIETTNFTAKAEWRRLLVNEMITKISNLLKSTNVAFGVSVSSMYKNGNGIVTYEDGKVISTGAIGSSNQYSHYDNQFCDSLYWINNSLIDFIIPRLDKTIAYANDSYASEVDWWSKVTQNSNTIFISTISLVNYYTRSNGFITYSITTSSGWRRTITVETTYTTTMNEAYNQLLYTNKYESIKGICFDSFRALIDPEINQLVGITATKDILYNTEVQKISLK